MEGAGGYENGIRFQRRLHKLPGVELMSETVWGLPLDSLSPANGRRIDGIIGYELFSTLSSTLTTSDCISICRPQTYNHRGTGQSIPLKVQPDGAIYVDATLELAGRKPIEGEFVIDTGGNSSLMLARNYVEQNRLLESVGRTIQAGGGGVGGPIQLEFGRLKSLQLGRFVINNPLTGFVRVGEIADTGKSGNIGGKCLRRFRVTFDYSRQRMILEPNANYPTADEFDMSGAAIVGDGPDLSTIKLLKSVQTRPLPKQACALLM